MKLVACNSCGSKEFVSLFNKPSSIGEIFYIVKCRYCGLVQVNPQPTADETIKYYSGDYFRQRTDRGYADYYSEKTKQEINRVFQLNLADLGFNNWIKSHATAKSSLDIGCAAGYFVEYMKNLGWQSSGIEIAEEPSAFARDSLGLDIIQKDFLQWDADCNSKFDLITLWATIEHLHQPRQTIQKAYKHLNPGGMLIVSTCRYGLLARFHGKMWRG